MAAANRHRRAKYWFQTVICRLIDYGVVNTRAVFKELGFEYKMVDLKRTIAKELLDKCREKTASNSTQTEGEIVERHFEKPTNRLDNRFHSWESRGKVRRVCVVHKNRRCETNKFCYDCKCTPM